VIDLQHWIVPCRPKAGHIEHVADPVPAALLRIPPIVADCAEQTARLPQMTFAKSPLRPFRCKQSDSLHGKRPRGHSPPAARPPPPGGVAMNGLVRKQCCSNSRRSALRTETVVAKPLFPRVELPQSSALATRSQSLLWKKWPPSTPLCVRLSPLMLVVAGFSLISRCTHRAHATF
jgi:hypothetical protein